MEETIALLLRQHDELLACLDATARELAALTAPLARFVTRLEAELDGHFTVEEQTLFPKLAASADVTPGTIALVLDEHAAVRARTRALAEAVDHGSVAQRVAAAESLIDLLRAHVAKEDAMLLAVAAAIPNL
ncbi:MAG: hemerythrin domain-containing protein [Deltaproteobacteria bacterium]|nr:hemerythrin domain-containing protein [Deltaproteobacteria bacterium]